MKLLDVAPGQSFEVTAISDLKGEVLSHSLCGTRVLWGKAARVVKIETAKGTTEFESPGKPVLISSGTEVTLVR